MIVKYGNYTDPTLDINELINKIKKQEINFKDITTMAEDNKISGADLCKIVISVSNFNKTDPKYPVEILYVEPIRRSLDYQLSNK